MSIGYSEFINQLENAGFNTTHVNSAKGEADFSDYGNALSDDIQSMVTDSFDCEADYDLQAQISSLYGNRNFLNRADFIAGCKALGFTVEASYVQSTYIADNKADGRFDTDITTASIGMYKISDGKGGEIIIADANGNGALEIEELFMNQILEDVAVDINKINANKIAGAAALAAGGGSSSSVNSILDDVKKEAEEKEKAQDKKDFNKEVEKYLKNGKSLSMAEQLARSIFNDASLSYTGSMEEQPAAQEDGVSQKDYNKLVQHLITSGNVENVIAAEKKASNELNVSEFSFSGEDPFKDLDKELFSL